MSKPDSKGGEEMSMEEILASIRKMIAQEQDAEAPRTVEPEDEPDDEDVLELTDMLPEAGELDAEFAPEPLPEAGQQDEWEPPLPEEEMPQLGPDLGDEPLELAPEFAVPEDQGAHEPPSASVPPEQDVSEPSPRRPFMVGLSDMMEEVSGEPSPEPEMADIPRFLDELRGAVNEAEDRGDEQAQAEPPPAAEPPGDYRDDYLEHTEREGLMEAENDRILSPESALRTSSAFDQLAQTLVSGYEGEDKTLEGVVRAMLKPLMREWLDANLPRIVDEMVQAEIRRLSRS
ncbi:MAG: DUF2497 domain-containing protein [Alphaproteobacteria bacterium]|nr:DUF2497 domain-containing protein [Alphaproteobacteria bacterium]